MRFKLLVILLLYAGLARADWTGVSVEIANVDADWKFDSSVREARINSIAFQIEEETATGLSVGGGIGYLDMRVAGDSSTDTRKFDGEYLQIYLRQKFRINESISLHGLFGYSYNSGRDNKENDRADIDWNEASIQIDASLRFANFGITPFAAYYDIDGDISDDNGTEVFKMDDPVSYGIRFDYYTEPTAFIRFVFQSGGQSGGYLTFVRRY
ncbi:MAG: hypothetical protein KJN95_08685 [Gammaproteobacteria bacterium]|nr:hypothetical protein [Gammaproteobacteria bacterium]